MKTQITAFATLVFSATVLSACGGGGPGSGGGEARFVAACKSTTNMPDAMCDCLASKAKNDLTSDGFAMLLASLEEDRGAADRLRRSMPLEEVTQAGMFMATAPAACAAEGHNR